MDSERLGKLMEAGDYHEVLSKYIEIYVHPDDRQKMTASTRLEVLLKRVPEIGLYKLDYRRSLDDISSYYEMNVAKTVDENNTIIFIMGLRDVNDEMQKQLEQARILEAQSEIIEGLGSEYYSVLLVDP